MGGPEKKEHVELMRQFLDKQKNLCFRIQLSQDPQALEMKERIKDVASCWEWIPKVVSMNSLRKWTRH